MTVNDSRLLKGTLVFGEVGTPQATEGQITNLIVEQTDGDTEDVATVLSGETVGGNTLPGPWHITGTMIQDFDTATSFQQWSYLNKDTEQKFTFTPNDALTAPTITGSVTVKFLGLGGDVKTRITRDFDWGLVGDPDFGTWGTPVEGVQAASEKPAKGEPVSA